MSAKKDVLHGEGGAFWVREQEVSGQGQGTAKGSIKEDICYRRARTTHKSPRMASGSVMLVVETILTIILAR